MARKKTAFLAQSTVTGAFRVKGDGDKAELVTQREDLDGARQVQVNVQAGNRVEKGALLPCIEKALIERGVLVEREVKSDETLADVSGSDEGDTSVEVTPMSEAKGKKGR